MNDRPTPSMARAAVLVVLALAAAAPAAAGAARIPPRSRRGGRRPGAPRRQPWVPAELLAGRLTVDVPPGARVVPGPRRPPAETDPVERTTHTIINHGGRQLLIVARETLDTAGEDFGLKALRKGLAQSAKNGKATFSKAERWRPDPAFTANSKKPPLSGFLLTRASPKTPGGDTVLRTLLVRMGDDSLVMIDVVGNSRARGHGLKIADRILATLRPGKRKLACGAGRRLLRLGAGVALELTVEKGFVLLRRRGAGFETHRLRPLIPFGVRAPHLAIGCAQRPHRQYLEPKDKRPAVTRSEGRLLGCRAAWHSWSTSEKGAKVLWLQATVEAPLPPVPGDSAAPFKLDVVIRAYDEASLAKLRGMAEGMKKVKVAVSPEGSDYLGDIVARLGKHAASQMRAAPRLGKAAGHAFDGEEFLKEMQAVAGDIREIKPGLEVGKAVTTELPMNPFGVRLDAVKFTVPAGGPRDMIWSFVAPPAMRNWYILPAKGPRIQGFRRFERVPARGGTRIYQFLGAHALKPGHEYVLWFSFAGSGRHRMRFTLCLPPRGRVDSGMAGMVKALGPLGK